MEKVHAMVLFIFLSSLFMYGSAIKTTLLLSCDFETPCDKLTNSAEDDFNWTKVNGATISYDTGPNHDHTTADGDQTGYYMYTEPPSGGQRAVLVSDGLVLGAGCDAELSFWYNMYGTAVGELKVERIGFRGAIFSMKGQQHEDGDTWTQANVLFSHTTIGDYTVQFKIIGVTGSGTKGDIGLDDVTVTEECQDSPDPPKVTQKAPTTRSVTTAPNVNQTPPVFPQRERKSTSNYPDIVAIDLIPTSTLLATKVQTNSSDVATPQTPTGQSSGIGHFEQSTQRNGDDHGGYRKEVPLVPLVAGGMGILAVLGSIVLGAAIRMKRKQRKMKVATTNIENRGPIQTTTVKESEGMRSP